MPPRNKLSKLSKASSSKRSFAVVLEGPAAEKFEQRADALGLDVGELLSQHLQSTVDYVAEKPVFFNDNQRQELERLLDYNFNLPEEVLERLRGLLTVVKLEIPGDLSFGDTQVRTLALTPTQLYRLSGRCNYGATVYDKAYEFAKQGIDREIGLY